MSSIPVSFDDYLVTPTAKHAESLSTAKTYVSLASMMISYAMYRCEFYFIKGCPALRTAGAAVYPDGNKVFLDEDFWFSCLENDKQRAFTLYHEVLHIFLGHSFRCAAMGYNHKLWNLATDYVINIAAHGSYRGERDESIEYSQRMQKYIQLPSAERMAEFFKHQLSEDNKNQFGVLYDEQYIGLSSDEVYEKLLQEIKDKIKSGELQPSNGDGNGDPVDGIDLSDLFGDALDDIIGGDESSDDMRRQIQKNRQTIAAGATAAEQARGIGDSEAHLKQTIMETIKPAVRWEDHLTSATLSKIPVRTTYSRYSRRNGGSVIFPSHVGDHLNVMFGVDSSGSMSMEDFKRCYTEFLSVLGNVESWKVWLVTCDTTAHLISTFDSEEGCDADDIEFSIVGGGGTDMRPLLDFAEELCEQGEELDVCLVMTDGYIPEASVDEITPIGYQSLFLVTDGGNRNLKLKNHEVIFSTY